MNSFKKIVIISNIFINISKFLSARTSLLLLSKSLNIVDFFCQHPNKYLSYNYVPINLYIPYGELLNDFPFPLLLTFIKKFGRTVSRLEFSLHVNGHVICTELEKFCILLT